MLVCQGVQAALVDLPGTLLVTSAFSGQLRQYNATTGQLVGSLQITLNNQPAISTIGVGVLNGSIYMSGYSAVIGGVGIVNPQTGAINATELPVSTANIDDQNGNLVFGSGGRPYRIYDPMFNQIGDGLLTVAAGTFTSEMFVGLAATSNGFVTSYNPFWNQIQFFDSLGFYDHSYFFNNPVSTFAPCALEFDEQTSEFWFAQTDGTSSIIKRYADGDPNAQWTINVPGYIADLAYIPIPSPNSLGLVALSSIASVSRRRRRHG